MRTGYDGNAMNYPMPYGAYTLLEPIGKGGMSAIELAQTSVTGAQYVRFLVIKRMLAQYSEDDTFVRMFQDEARINAELQHANIAQVYDFGHIGEEYYMAMEYVPGVDLRALQRAVVRRGRKIPIRITLRILADVLEALHYAHNRLDTFGQPMRIVHRDVNPRNVMISVRGEIKLIDFGVAKADTKKEQTIGHVLKGKFSYMCPEQIEGAGLDGRGDLFSTGLMLHELVEHRRPFAKMHEMQILKKILAGAIPPMEGPEDHPSREMVQAIHKRALEVKPEDRYQNASEMREAIIHAAQPCGGLASDSDIAGFLGEIMPEKTQAIAARLVEYREEITQPDMQKAEATTPPAVSGERAEGPAETAKDPPQFRESSAPSPGDRDDPPTVTAAGKLPGGSGFPVYQVLSAGGLAALLLSAGWMWQQGNKQQQIGPPDAAVETEALEVIKTRPMAPKKKEPSVELQQAGKEAPQKKEKKSRKRRSAQKKKSAETKNPKEAAGEQETNEEPSDKAPAGKEGPAELAWVFVSSKTPGLLVFVDGEQKGQTPLRTQVPIGPRKIRIHNKEKNLDYVKTLEVKKQEINTFHAEGQ